MQSSTLVVSNPPHEDVDLESAAELLGLDVFATGLKSTFPAPEILGAGGPDSAVRLAVGLRKTGLRVTVLQGVSLLEVPWPDPVSYLAFDDECLRVAVRDEVWEVPYATSVLGVLCQTPANFSIDRRIDLAQAIASGLGSTIAEALQWRSFIDLYLREDESVRRVTIVPEMFGSERGDDMVGEIERRFRRLRLDRRLAGVWPRSRFVRVDDDDEEEPPAHPSAQRKGYSFGTQRLAELMASISPDLEMLPQYELGSRVAYALDPPQAED